MIIGSGFIAKNFENYNDDLERLNICLYAAGISNSQTQDKNLLDKEKNKFIEFLKKFNQKKKLIYISTCSINDPSRNKNPYVLNKLYIEDLVQKNIKNFLIMRLPEVVGKNENKVTLINFLNNKIKNGEKFEIWSKAKRNIIDIDDAILLTINLLENKNLNNTIINVANPKSYFVTEIVKNFEKLNNVEANYNLVDRGQDNWHLDTNKVLEMSKKIKINFNENYLYKLLKKYYF
jgi:nucleoside-diphosphate-sugar epimerase|tara:strand:+ start:120 stop:821 length:702 start_codon:yes stop_codon:yes gene_type:complete